MYQKEMLTYRCDGVLLMLKVNHAEHMIYLYMGNLASIRAKDSGIYLLVSQGLKRNSSLKMKLR